MQQPAHARYSQHAPATASKQAHATPTVMMPRGYLVAGAQPLLGCLDPGACWDAWIQRPVGALGSGA